MWTTNQQLVDIAREYMTQHILFADAYLKAFLLDNECLDCGKVMSVVFWWQQQIFLFNPLNSVVRITDVCVHLLCIWQRLQTRQPENVICDLSLQSKGEQCNSKVSHHRPCRGREPCHRLGQGKSGRRRGTATDQMDQRGILEQEDPDMHELGHRILPTQPHMRPGDFQVKCSIEL